MKTHQLERTDPNQSTTSTQSTNAQSVSTPEVKDPKKWAVAQQFEAMFLHQMLTAMRKTVPEDGLTKESNGRQIFTDMLDEEMSKKASNQGNLGIAKMIYKQLSPKDRVPTKNTQYSVPGTYSSTGRPARASESQVNTWITAAAKSQDLDPSLLRSLVHHESAGDSLAVSKAGAIGLTQLMPATAKELGVKNPWDGQENLKAGAKYLKTLLKKFGGREDLALAAYNAGPSAVIRHGGIPPYRETMSYVKKVLDGRAKMKNREVEYAT